MLEVLVIGSWAFGGGTACQHLCEVQITKKLFQNVYQVVSRLAQRMAAASS